MIDISFDFTSDSPNYWDDYWKNNDGLGSGNSDPDSASKTLQKYHQILWSKRLPCGETMNLVRGPGSNYLTWKDFRFGSDSIIVSFRYKRKRELINAVEAAVPDYRLFMENYVHRSYTIGGMTIFPKHPNSINQNKGTNPLVADRWDLTLECIRRYYQGETSPLYEILLRDKKFFDLFVDFKGYVDYFFFQDCVSDDYSKVKVWLGSGDFNEDPYPKTVEEYLSWINTELEFVAMRNQRIDSFQKNNLK